MFISSAFAQAAPAPAGGDLLSGMFPILLMFVLLYFLMIRPQMKKAKEQRAMMEALKAGDEIITMGGVLGKIVKVSEAYITLEVAKQNGNSVELHIQKGAVQTLLPNGTLSTLGTNKS